MFTVQ